MKDVIIHDNPFDVEKTLRIIQENFEPAKKQVAEIAKTFEYYKNDRQRLVIEVHYYLRQNFNYKADTFGKEEIRLPNASFREAKTGIDCEDFTLMAAAIMSYYVPLKDLKYRVVDYGNGWQHIYLVISNTLVYDYYIDAVIEQPNEQLPFYRKKDYVVTINQLSGIGDSSSMQIERMLNQKDSFSKDEIELLMQYEGQGGQAKKGNTDQGVLYEFYTPKWLAEKIYDLALYYGYKEGHKILEPSIGTGRLIEPFPKYADVTGFEINELSAKIAKIALKGATIHNEYFETHLLAAPRFTTPLPKNQKTWLKDYPFDFVIGNPPYGIYKNFYRGILSPKQIPSETFELNFILWGLDLLKSGGVLIYLVSQNIMRFNKYEKDLLKVSEKATFLDAYRLPTVFKNSEVPTDILIFRKK